MKVLVTGGAGFIGSHLVDAFMARGDEVAVADDLSHGRLTRLDPGATLHMVSITDPVALAGVVAGFRPELICHLAAQIDVRVSVAAPAQDAQVNVVGTVNVLEAARAVGARVVFASSGGALYGQDAPIPSREDVLAQPESPYGIAKYCAEQYIGLYNRLHGTSHSVLRLANVYGPRQDPAGEAGGVPVFCARGAGGGGAPTYRRGKQTPGHRLRGDGGRALPGGPGAAGGRVQQLSHGRLEHNHLPDGPAQRERDAAFAAEDPLSHNGWLYSYDAEAAVSGG